MNIHIVGLGTITVQITNGFLEYHAWNRISHGLLEYHTYYILMIDSGITPCIGISIWLGRVPLVQISNGWFSTMPGTCLTIPLFVITWNTLYVIVWWILVTKILSIFLAWFLYVFSWLYYVLVMCLYHTIGANQWSACTLLSCTDIVLSLSMLSTWHF